VGKLRHEGLTWRNSAVAQPGLAGTRGGGLIGGACTSVRGREREGAEDGRRESKRKAYSGEYAKGVCGPMRGMTAYK
jgi:hypothetical protein